MKRAVLSLLAWMLIAGSCFGLTGCSSVSKSDVVGVWEKAQGEEEAYLYVYKDGTGDGYWKSSAAGEWGSFHSFEWKIEEDYFVVRAGSLFDDGVLKYTVEDGCMYDAQGKLSYRKTIF